ncbi:MAG: hypothetical protein HYX90_01245 [Chloroflexi bacterium]|nr:hypothetical protein [Chloroflexota bacterium]
MPKLTLRSLLDGAGVPAIPIDSLDQVRPHFDPNGDTIVVVEGQLVTSYDQLVELVTRGELRGREAVELLLLPLIDGG